MMAGWRCASQPASDSAGSRAVGYDAAADRGAAAIRGGLPTAGKSANFLFETPAFQFQRQHLSRSISMTLSLYQVSVPVYARQLNGLSAILQKAIAYCAERKIDPAVLLQDRLFPDMFPLVWQVQVACNHAERGTSRLAGLEPPSRNDKDASLEDLAKRVVTAIAYVQGVDARKMDGMENRDITFPVGDEKMTLKGADYLLHFSLPNFYFHVTTAYNILRHNGVRIGKTDYLGT
jgi:uncharacterized protein